MLNIDDLETLADYYDYLKDCERDRKMEDGYGQEKD